MSALCPRCGQPLSALPAGAFTLGACRACAGVFAQNDAAAHVASELDEPLAQAVTRVSVGAADMSAMPDESPALACPMCRTPMSRVAVASTFVDTCTAHGTWFDAWELERVIRERARTVAERAKPWVAVGTRERVGAAPSSLENDSTSVVAGVGEGLGQAAAEVLADGALSFAIDGLFAVIAALFE